MGFKIGYKKLNENEKSAFWSLICDAASIIPGVGAAVNVGKDAVEFYKAHKDKIEPLMEEIDKPENITENQLCIITETLKKILPEVKLSEYYVSKREELADIILEKYDSQLILSDDSAEMFEYIKYIVDVLCEKITEFETPDSNINTLFKEVKNIEERVSALESDKNKETKNDDTVEYIRSFTEPLFLDTDKKSISLSTMFVEPYLKNEDVSVSSIIKDWYNNDKKNNCYILYGDAGVGKSSLVSKIVADSNDVLSKKKLFDFPSDKIHVIALRNHIKSFNNLKSGYSPIETVKDIFSEEDIDLENHLIILDGFDELCVLLRDFDGSNFIKKLDRNTRKAKVLITSREAEYYFELPKGLSQTLIKRIEWKTSQVNEWCDNYACLNPDRSEWCSNFKKQYAELPENSDEDKRYEIFRVPIILYLSCISNLDINKNSSIGSIYDFAFKQISDRVYIRNQEGSDRLIDDDEKQKAINWQYTKELAYQMFLNNKLTISGEDIIGEEKCIDLAKRKTKEILLEQGKITEEEEISFDVDNQRYLAVFHFAKGVDENQGIEFAHKTAYEYFTAVKIYEDYFRDINAQTGLDEVWRRLFEAFRYKPLGKEIFEYLNALPIDKDEQSQMNFEMLTKKIFEVIAREKIIEYVVKNEPSYHLKLKNKLIDEMNNIFINLTWFLTEKGFRNTEQEMDSEVFSQYLNYNINPINCTGWEFKEANFYMAKLSCSLFSDSKLNNAVYKRTDLSFSSFRNAELSKAIFINANLEYADFENADLFNADLRSSFLLNTNFLNASLRSAFLTNSDLEGADLSGADLIGADLNGVHIKDTVWTAAKYCTEKNWKTIFPEGFDPKEHGMIEVDRFGTPIDDE